MLLTWFIGVQVRAFRAPTTLSAAPSGCSRWRSLAASTTIHSERRSRNLPVFCSGVLGMWEARRLQCVNRSHKASNHFVMQSLAAVHTSYPNDSMPTMKFKSYKAKAKSTVATQAQARRSHRIATHALSNNMM